MTVRAYVAKDRDAVESICLATADTRLAKNKLMRDALLDCFCRWYLTNEPENCFVALDGQDQPIGYILCAEDFARWESSFMKSLHGLLKNPVSKLMGRATVDSLRPYSTDYPAHLHIDILPAYQRQGIGGQLLNALCDHLREINIPGVMLSVAKDNEKGVGYYQKHGFELLGERKEELFFGIRV